jgi:hypothetical protein
MSIPQPAPATTGKIPTVKSSQLAENAAICMVVPLGDPNDSTSQRGVTPIYWGLPGIGKSAIMRQAARMVQLHMEVMYPSHHNPEDFGSIDVPDGMGGMKTVCGIPQIRRLIAKGEGVLVIDEAGNAPPAVQSASLSLIVERNVGDDTLPPGIRILAAANPVECAAGGWDFEAPTANRFLHWASAVPTKEEWLKWYMGESSHAATPATALWDIVTREWGSAYPRAKGMVGGFINAKGASVLHKLPGEEDPQRSRSWPSPRTWDMTGRCIATLIALKKEELIDDFVQAAVGEGAALEFNAWRRSFNLPTPEDMLRHGWSPDRRRIDISIGALLSMTEFVTNSPEKMKWAAAAWGILERCCEAGMSDLAMASTEVFVNNGMAEDDLETAIVLAAKPVIKRLTKRPDLTSLV